MRCRIRRIGRGWGSRGSVGAMSPKDVWEAVYRRFDPEHPAAPAMRADRPHSPAAAICESLDMPFADPRELLVGTVGTGKTTELLRIFEARQGKEFVVFLDLERHFEEVLHDAPALQNISSWEVCFLAGIALISRAKEALDYDFPKAHLDDLANAWRKLAAATETPVPAQLDVGALAKAMLATAATVVPLVASGPVAGAVGAGLAAASGMAGASKWNLAIARGKRSLPDQDKEMESLLACVNVLVGLIQTKASRVLFIIDGLDRIRDVERAKALFIDSQMIARLACPSVVCGPFALRHHPMTAAVRRSTPRVLVNEPVLLQSSPAEHGPGVAFFCDLFDKRAHDLGGADLCPRPLLEELAYRSGGRARDFITFIRNIAAAAWSEAAPAVTEEIVRAVLRERRLQREMGLHKGHLDLLQAVADDPRHALPSGALAQELLDYQTLLPYPNESEWYYPHPLLLMHLIRAGAAPASGSTGSSGSSG
jgi:hypothetical protein